MEHVAATRCADLRKNILFSSFWNVCGFWKFGWKKREKKSQKKSVIERSIDRSSRRSFFLFFLFFPSRVSCFWSTRTSIRAIILFLVILLTERRERGKSEERREKREKMAASVSWSQRWLRPEVRKIVLFWVYSIHFEEEERNVYPLFSRCFIISHQIVLSFIHKIIIKQVYPIFAALGSAVGLCTFFCTRQLTTSPGFTASKAKRATAIPETSQDVKEGEKFRNHFIRRTLSGRRPEIMPGLNSSMTKMN